MIVNKFPLWNIKWVQITIDGLEQEYLRRKCYCCDTSGLFENLLKNIEILLRNEIHVSIRLNIDKNNMDECVNVAEYLYNRFGEFSYLNVYPAFIAGNKDSVSDENERIFKTKMVSKKSDVWNKVLNEFENKNVAQFIAKYMKDYDLIKYLTAKRVQNNEFTIDKEVLKKALYSLGNEFSDETEFCVSKSIDGVYNSIGIDDAFSNLLTFGVLTRFIPSHNEEYYILLNEKESNEVLKHLTRKEKFMETIKELILVTAMIVIIVLAVFLGTKFLTNFSANGNEANLESGAEIVEKLDQTNNENLNKYIENVENLFEITYNAEQKDAIKCEKNCVLLK